MSRYLIISFDANGFICKVHGADGSADIKATLLGVSRHLNTERAAWRVTLRISRRRQTADRREKRANETAPR